MRALRKSGHTPREQGTNLRARGVSPRQLRRSPRWLRALATHRALHAPPRGDLAIMAYRGAERRQAAASYRRIEKAARMIERYRMLRELADDELYEAEAAGEVLPPDEPTIGADEPP